MVNTGIQRTDQRKSALIAGISLIIMTLASFFSYGFVHASLVVQGDASATFHHIMSSSTLFKAEILGWVIILTSDIVVAWAFYIFLEPINKSLSLLGAWFRLTYTAILGIAILNLIFVLLLSRHTNDLSSFKIEQTQSLMMLFLEAFESIWSIGLIVFGGHLLIVGYVAIKSNGIPKIISILLVIAGVGYMLNHLCSAFLPQYDGVITVLKFVFTVPMIVGELGFGLWLLFKGGKVPITA
ncbi:hypothetical protein BVG16_08400 [Paenibacillus selenitireducens]|uniref:DUF4386 domain-containing protein n=1 Tax=Paenibacillus selenitireducens TaxID=1324314 RepID=A0A1T2XGU1_9BACL|nr:DUF4386 domain-containing protein [Paenibacillus selenitireducens]OPA79111.1 hypothetical protein BVG16_08400 [Paenibacillus selenitireducens]